MCTPAVQPPEISPIEKAIEIAGGPVAMARRITAAHPDRPVTYQGVQKWAAQKRVPPKRVLAVEAAVDARVTRHELDPELYPPEGAAA